MKYKVGDKILVEAEVIEIDISDAEFPIKIVYETGNTSWVLPELIHELPKSDKTYEQGLEDAWELARKLYNVPIEEIFAEDAGSGIGARKLIERIIEKYSPQEALAKLKAYEEAQSIKVWDVVKCGARTFVVTCIEKDAIYGIDKNGDPVATTQIGDVKKTGKHVDIAGLLEQIRG